MVCGNDGPTLIYYNGRWVYIQTNGPVSRLNLAEIHLLFNYSYNMYATVFHGNFA